MMNINNKDLADLLRKIPAHNASLKTHCPSSKELVASFAPSASKRLKNKITDHIYGCPKCREVFDLLLSFIEHDKQAKDSLNTEKQCSRFLKSVLHYPSPRLLSARFSSLIVGCLMIIVSIFIIAQHNDVSRQFRGGNTNIILEYPGATHNIADKLIFQWAPYTPASYYILELFDEALLPVWTSSRTEAPQIPISEEARSLLKPGKAYFWMVTAYSGAGDIKESNLARFVVTEE
jgi:hypothetical protein